MKTKILVLFMVCLCGSRAATLVEVWNMVPTNAVVVCDGHEFELPPGHSLKIHEADGLLVWQDLAGGFIASHSTIDSYTSAQAVLALDSLGAPAIRYTGFFAPWESQWQWYLGGVSVGMACFFFAYTRRSADRLIGGGEAE